MNSNEKRWVVLLVAVLVIAIVLAIVLSTIGKNEEQVPEQGQVQQEQTVNEEKYTTQLEDGTKINTSEELNGTKTYGDLEITNVQFTEKDGVSTLLADVTNKGTTTHESEVVKITILGENGETITELKAPLGEVKAGETIKLNTMATADITNAKDLKIEAAE